MSITWIQIYGLLLVLWFTRKVMVLPRLIPLTPFLFISTVFLNCISVFLNSICISGVVDLVFHYFRKGTLLLWCPWPLKAFLYFSIAFLYFSTPISVHKTQVLQHFDVKVMVLHCCLSVSVFLNYISVFLNLLTLIKAFLGESNGSALLPGYFCNFQLYVCISQPLFQHFEAKVMVPPCCLCISELYFCISNPYFSILRQK